jgi:antitoxin HicB
MLFVYPVELEEDRTDGHDWGLVVTFPDIPEAITSGKVRQEALVNAADCLEEALAGRINRREDIPSPTPARGRPTVAPGSLIAAKAALHLTMRREGVRPAELARRMGVEQPAIDRLLNPRHASKADQFDAAFRALGKRLVFEREDAA